MFLNAWFNPYLEIGNNDRFRVRMEVRWGNWSAIWYLLINENTDSGKCMGKTKRECIEYVGNKAIEWTATKKRGHELGKEMLEIMKRSVREELEKLTPPNPPEPPEPPEPPNDPENCCEALLEVLESIKQQAIEASFKWRK